MKVFKKHPTLYFQLNSDIKTKLDDIKEDIASKLLLDDIYYSPKREEIEKLLSRTYEFELSTRQLGDDRIYTRHALVFENTDSNQMIYLVSNFYIKRPGKLSKMFYGEWKEIFAKETLLYAYYRNTLYNTDLKDIEMMKYDTRLNRVDNPPLLIAEK